MVRLPRVGFAALLPVLALGLATLLGGCEVYPADGYGYGYGSGGYYGAPAVGYGGWGRRHHGHHDDD